MEPLLPIRHAQQDLFICDIFDTWKDDMGSMEHPVFSLSTKPDYRVRHYEHNGNTLTVKPGSDGLATIHDKDVLLYLISHIMNDLNQKREEGKKTGAKEIEAPPKRLRFTAYDMLILTNRPTNNLGYKRLEAALDRLKGTVLKTNIKANKKLITKSFGLIDEYEIVRERPEDEKSRMVAVEVKLSDWFYAALFGQEVLTISPDYFRLRKPLERRLYELCRKHCGKQPKWEIGLELLHKKTGAISPLKRFRQIVHTIAKSDHLPDYRIEFDSDRDVLIVRPRKAPTNISIQSGPVLKTQTYDNAQKILAPHGLDKYAVEAEWVDHWERTGRPEFKTNDGAFIGFCKNKIASL